MTKHDCSYSRTHKNNEDIQKHSQCNQHRMTGNLNMIIRMVHFVGHEAEP